MQNYPACKVNVSVAGCFFFQDYLRYMLVLYNYALRICLSNSSHEDKYRLFGIIEVNSKSSQPYLEKGHNALFDIQLFKIQDCTTLSTISDLSVVLT